jgi:hypothetical protein
LPFPPLAWRSRASCCARPDDPSFGPPPPCPRLPPPNLPRAWQAKSGAARKALAAARLELERVSKENRELSEAREVALDSRNAILKKVRLRRAAMVGSGG